jgi:ketosteroid isomerase-like protein
MADATAQEVADKLAIIDVVNAYTRALDTRDWDLLKSCFTPDGDADFGALVGVGVLDSPQALVDLCRTSLQDLKATQHLQGNYRVEVNGDTATAFCYFQANHFAEGTPGGENFVVWGSYRDQMVRTSDGWKIKHRELIPTFTGGNANLFAEAAELAGRTANA